MIGGAAVPDKEILVHEGNSDFFDANHDWPTSGPARRQFGAEKAGRLVVLGSKVIPTVVVSQFVDQEGVDVRQVLQLCRETICGPTARRSR